MGHNQAGALKIGKKALQPLHCMNIQVVGRFVQQQKIRLGQQQLCQNQLRLLSAGQLVRGHIKLLFRKAQAQQRRACHGFISQSALSLGLLCQTVLQGNIRRCIPLPAAQAIANFFQLALQFHQRLKHADQLVPHGVAGRAGMLLHIAQLTIFREKGAAAVRRVVAADHLKQRGLTHAVGANKAHFLPLFDGERHTGKQRALPKRQG